MLAKRYIPYTVRLPLPILSIFICLKISLTHKDNISIDPRYLFSIFFSSSTNTVSFSILFASIYFGVLGPSGSIFRWEKQEKNCPSIYIQNGVIDKGHEHRLLIDIYYSFSLRHFEGFVNVWGDIFFLSNWGWQDIIQWIYICRYIDSKEYKKDIFLLLFFLSRRKKGNGL